ncbi:MAG TPA: hypothetical protein VN881_12460 [Candidatus Acidoferrales bacterium]|jgi:hypothetical protein|nr:hypothetical protein [Candidatus Acidoferrales bacterium]
MSQKLIGMFCGAAIQMFSLIAAGSAPFALEEPYTPSQQSADANGLHERKGIRFEKGTSGDLIQDGILLGMTLYKASDGASLAVVYNNFEDTSQASAFFDKELVRASKALSKGDKLDRDGKIIGKRAEIRLAAPNDKLTAVMWTDGRKFHEIQSTSLRDILELERVYKY